MALRKHVPNVFKWSTAISLSLERCAFPSSASISKNIFQHKPVEQIEQQRFRDLSRTHPLSLPHVSPSVADIFKTSESESSTHEYKCPSSLTHRFSQLVILDNQIKPDYQLPLGNPIATSLIDPLNHNNSNEITEPTPFQYTPAKEAKEILRIRHKKMKKHKLRKLRKRMYFLWRKQKLARRAKRDAIYWKEINEIKKESEDFDAESFVKEQLQKAKRGGYFINVFDSKV